MIERIIKTVEFNTTFNPQTNEFESETRELVIEVGKPVQFKYDIEQSAIVEEIRKTYGGHEVLVTATQGGYVCGPTQVWIDADSCF
jgi:hypothetical protein